MEGCNKGLRGQKQTTSLRFRAFAEDLVVFEVFTIESKGERERQTGIERVRIGRAAGEGERVIEV